MNTLLTGLAMGESPRWHDGRLWLSDMGANEVIRTDLDGKRACVLGGPEGDTLFVTTAAWPPPEDSTRTGRVLTVQAPARSVGYP